MKVNPPDKGIISMRVLGIDKDEVEAFGHKSSEGHDGEFWSIWWRDLVVAC